jgi:hypothetical protein
MPQQRIAPELFLTTIPMGIRKSCSLRSNLQYAPNLRIRLKANAKANEKIRLTLREEARSELFEGQCINRAIGTSFERNTCPSRFASRRHHCSDKSPATYPSVLDAPKNRPQTPSDNRGYMPRRNRANSQLAEAQPNSCRRTEYSKVAEAHRDLLFSRTDRSMSLEGPFSAYGSIPTPLSIPDCPANTDSVLVQHSEPSFETSRP